MVDNRGKSETEGTTPSLLIESKGKKANQMASRERQRPVGDSNRAPGSPGMPWQEF
jgi:hypothetical protein